MELTGSKVIGLDISLTSTGVSDGVTADAIQVGPIRGEERMNVMLSRIRAHTRWAMQLAVIEGPSFASLGPGHDELAGMRWMVRRELYNLGFQLAIVSPAALKKYTTGNGRASKEEMTTAVAGRWGVDFSNVKVGRGRHDMVDAYALAKMGEAFLAGDGYAGVEWPKMGL
jgi:crossover junction endodeoxyribonuclease RuvC